MKLNFFDILINRHNPVEAKEYYIHHLQQIVKELKGRMWERKNRIFLKILKNPDILKDKNIIQKNFNNFTLLFNRTFYKYLIKDNSEEINIDGLIKNKKYLHNENEEAYDMTKINKRLNETLADNNECVRRKHEECSDFSTREEISDFEDIIDNSEPSSQATNQLSILKEEEHSKNEDSIKDDVLSNIKTKARL